jgi:uncharacterized cupredoxin-like copper-binding protein
MLKNGAAFAALLTVAAVVVACAGPAAPSPSPPGPRTIEVTMTDDLRFGPSSFTVSAGETVRFVVHNAGQAVHEFYIGDEEAQMHHAEEMSMGAMMHDDPDGVTVQPGETETLEYTFTEAGQLLVGCHEPGHYAGGMVGTIDVE